MIVNLTKNTVISKHLVQKTGIKKFIGLMGKDRPETIIFKTRFGIHTFFLKFPIDLIIVSKEKRVVFIKKSVKPNRVVFWDFRYDTVIELPEGLIKKLNINKGSILKF